jgi:hypothetical protein
MTGATANRSVLGSLNDLAFLSRAVIDEQPEIDLTMLAMGGRRDTLRPAQVRESEIGVLIASA